MRAPVSLCVWKSRKLPRKAGSPQLVETYVASYGSADMNWVRVMFYSTMYSDFDIVMPRPRHFAIHSTAPTVLRIDSPSVRDPECSLVSASKGLYDALNNELPQDDNKSAVEMPIVEEMLKRMNGRSRWVPLNFNPSDGLTKLKGAHMAPLIDLLQSGMYHLRRRKRSLSSGLMKKSKQVGQSKAASVPASQGQTILVLKVTSFPRTFIVTCECKVCMYVC